MNSLKEGIVFPTNYYVIDIFDEYENQKYKDFLIHLSEQTNGEKRSNRNGWQSDTFLWKKKIFNSLLNKVLENSKKIAMHLSKKDVPQMVIRSMWGNINPKGGFNFYSCSSQFMDGGVYYIQLPEGNNEIVFEDPRPARMMDFQRSSLIKDEYFTHYSKVGQLLLFPLGYLILFHQIHLMKIEYLFHSM